MSGNRARRLKRTSGGAAASGNASEWQEAGDEFFRETYPSRSAGAPRITGSVKDKLINNKVSRRKSSEDDEEDPVAKIKNSAEPMADKRRKYDEIKVIQLFVSLERIFKYLRLSIILEFLTVINWMLDYATSVFFVIQTFIFVYAQKIVKFVHFTTNPSHRCRRSL
jgi:hypothetical protein